MVDVCSAFVSLFFFKQIAAARLESGSEPSPSWRYPITCSNKIKIDTLLSIGHLHRYVDPYAADTIFPPI